MESGKGTDIPVQNTRKLKILQCERSPFRGKTPWRSDYTTPVIENVILQTHQKEQKVAAQKKPFTSSLQPPQLQETHYQKHYIEKDLPLLTRCWIPNEHLIFRGPMMSSSLYQNEFQKKNVRRSKSCKRESTLFKGLDCSHDCNNKTAYMEEFPTILPKKNYLSISYKSNYACPPLPKKMPLPKSRFETETTYLKNYLPFRIEKKASQKAVPLVITKGIIPRLASFPVDPHFKKSITTVELAKVADRFPRTGRIPCRPVKDSILSFGGKAEFGTSYDGNYIDPNQIRWFHGHRAAWKTPQWAHARARRFPVTGKVLGNPLTWRYE